jgi:hypothetical protein
MIEEVARCTDDDERGADLAIMLVPGSCSIGAAATPATEIARLIAQHVLLAERHQTRFRHRNISL